jgi:hypothetical protein
VSLFAGGAYGRWFGVATAALVAIVSLFDIPVYPFWSLCVFALSVIILYQLVKTPETRATGEPLAAAAAPGSRVIGKVTLHGRAPARLAQRGARSSARVEALAAGVSADSSAGRVSSHPRRFGLPDRGPHGGIRVSPR